MNATDPKYIASRAMMIVQSLTDGDDQPGDFDTAYGILCRFAVDVLNDAQGAVLDALRRPREEAHNALSHLSQRLYNMSKEVIDQLREPKGCSHGDDWRRTEVTEFTKERLAEMASDRHAAKFIPLSRLADLAAFTLAQMERAENAENGIAVCLETIKALGTSPPEGMTPTEAATAWVQEYERRRLRAEKAEAERDQALRDYSMALSEHGLTIQEKGVAIRRAEKAEAERDRLKKELAEAEEGIRDLAWWFVDDDGLLSETVPCSDPDCRTCNALMNNPIVRRARAGRVWVSPDVEGTGRNNNMEKGETSKHNETTAWLIEAKFGKLALPWWCGISRHNWSYNANEAVRFCRKIDAERAIESMGWSSLAIATQHIWLSLK